MVDLALSFFLSWIAFPLIAATLALLCIEVWSGRRRRRSKPPPRSRKAIVLVTLVEIFALLPPTAVVAQIAWDGLAPWFVPPLLTIALLHAWRVVLGRWARIRSHASVVATPMSGPIGIGADLLIAVCLLPGLMALPLAVASASRDAPLARVLGAALVFFGGPTLVLLHRLSEWRLSERTEHAGDR